MAAVTRLPRVMVSVAGLVSAEVRVSLPDPVAVRVEVAPLRQALQVVEPEAEALEAQLPQALLELQIQVVVVAVVVILLETVTEVPVDQEL